MKITESLLRLLYAGGIIILPYHTHSQTNERERERSVKMLQAQIELLEALSGRYNVRQILCQQLSREVW